MESARTTVWVYVTAYIITTALRTVCVVGFKEARLSKKLARAKFEARFFIP